MCFLDPIANGASPTKRLFAILTNVAVSEKLHRRDQMLEVAARLFSERGYHGTSMQHLAEGLGILRGSLYAHIESKEDLLFDIVDRGADRFISRLEEVVTSEVSPDEKVRLAVLAHVETVAEHLDASKVFLSDWRFLSDDRKDAIQAKRDLYESLMREIVEEGIEWEVFSESVDPKFGAIFILSTVNWLYQWYRPDGDLATDQVARILSNLILSGLGSGSEP